MNKLMMRLQAAYEDYRIRRISLREYQREIRRVRRAMSHHEQ